MKLVISVTTASQKCKFSHCCEYCTYTSCWLLSSSSFLFFLIITLSRSIVPRYIRKVVTCRDAIWWRFELLRVKNDPLSSALMTDLLETNFWMGYCNTNETVGETDDLIVSCAFILSILVICSTGSDNYEYTHVLKRDAFNSQLWKF